MIEHTSSLSFELLQILLKVDKEIMTCCDSNRSATLCEYSKHISTALGVVYSSEKTFEAKQLEFAKNNAVKETSSTDKEK